MAYEPLTPYKSKDDPLWYVFDENQNFKTFDTRGKAMAHIKAVKYPQNEGIEFNTSNTQSQKIEPIKPQKIEFATDEKKEEDKQQPSALSQFGASFGQGTRIGFTNLVDYARARNELGITASEGYYDKPIEEYSKEHQKAIDIFNKEIMAKGKINDNEYIEKILKDNNLNRSYVEGGKILTRRTKEEEDKLIANSVFSQQAKKINQWAMSNPLLVDSWEDIDDSWLNSLAQAVPSFLIPLTASIATRNPYIMMAYGGIQMYSDTYTTAEEYLDEGKITREEANTLANYVGAVSLVTNYLPFKDMIVGPKLVKKVLFDKAFEKGLHKKISTETFKKFTYEALQESVEEIASLSAEFTYRDDMTYEEVKSRLIRAYTIGGVLGGVTGGAFATLSKPQQKKHIDALVKQRNSVLPYKMNIDSNGNLSFNIKEEDFDSKKEYETIKKVLNDPDFKRRINPFNLAKKNPDTPVEFLIFDELNNENPNTDDVDIEYNKKLMTSIMTDEDIRKANYDPDNPQWLTAELQEGEEGYEEGKRKFKVHTLGSNIYNSSGGSIVLSEGVSQDVFVEELTEVLYKKLATTNPKLKRRIDRWIKKTTKILDDNNIGGPRNIELFSKFYTFNYLGYADTEFDLGQIAKMPKGILKDFDAIMGEQKDGTNLSFLFKGKSKGDVITETETDVDETSQTVETPEESFSLKRKMSYRLMVDPDYQMDHRPTEGPRAFDLLEKVNGDNFAPKDIYEEPRYYIGSTPNDYAEYNETIQFMNFLKQNRGNPNATVTIYRASPKNTLNIGDWITPSKSYAKVHSLHYEDSSKDLPVYQFQVKLKNIKWAGDTLEEWGYFPDKSNTKVELFNETTGKEIDTEESFALAPAVDDFSDLVKALSNVDLIDAIDVEKFADNKEIGNYLVERIQQLQKENNIDLKTKTGEYTDEQIEIISDVIVRETLNEIVNNPKNAGAWYSTNMENAIKLLGIIYPEILSNKNSRTTFVIGLAITSNGQTPEDNLRYALQVYDFYKEKNRFPETEDEFDSAGSVSPSMREGFVKYNSLVTMFGLDDANQFLNTRFKVGEIKYITGHQPSKEKVDQILPGSAIFGPKIGGAFYPNLQGAYEYVTMDRWFMRTMGRITGELINNVEDLKPQINRFRNTLLKTKGQIVKLGHKKTNIKLDEKRYPLQFKYNRKKIIKEYNIDENLLKTDDDYAIEKASEILRPYANDGFKNKTELNLATNNLVKKVIELIDSPRNGGQIISFRKIMKLATDKVNQKVKENNIEFSKLYPADLQAIIWFPEKRLYSKLRKSKSILRETSYEDEAKKILQSRGYDDKRIADILNTNEDYATKGGAFNQENEKSYRLAPKDNLVVNPETTKEYLFRRVQDELYRLKVIQDKVGDIPEDQDAYLKAELFIGKASDRIENFRTKELEPLVKELTDDGFTIEDLGDYLYARHSKERNKLILERTDGDKKDGSGMSSKDANEILNKFKNTKIKDYAKKVDTIINKTLDVLYDGELITKEDYDYYKSNKMFKNYVPLKGKPDEDSFLGIGKGFSVSGKDVKRAKGRESRANNPFVQVLADYEQAVIRAEKNQVGISFYNLIKENPSDIWEAKGLKHIPRYDSDGELQYFDPTQLKQKEIEVKIKGKRKIITINDKVLLDSMKKMGGFRPPQFLVNFNKFFRAVNTTLSPEFIITNFERDLQAGLFNLSADYKGLTSKTFKNIFKAQKGIWDNIQGKETEWSNLYKEYKKNGGKVGWFDQMTIDEKVGKLEKMLKTYQSKNKLGISLRATGKFINDINEMVESGVRLSTYKSLIEAGVSPKKSAQYSKNLTVNFNKKGEIGTFLNTFWVFSNAGIQGTARLFKMAQTKRGKKIVGSLIAVGFIQSLLNRLIDEEDWEKFSDFNKDNYYLVLLPNGKALSLKAPYGFNVFKVAGSLMEEMIFGDTTFAEASKRMLKSVNDAFNPIGGSSPFQIMSPTIFEPYAQIIENKNFFGGPIMPEQPAYQPKEANSQRYFKSVRKPSKAITTWLNKVTGGTDEISGLVDVSPEVVDHLIDTYTGSTGKFVGNLIDTGTSLAKDGQLPATNNIPVVRQFIKEESEYVSSKVVYYMINESKRTKFSPEQRKRFKRHISYMKEGQYNEEKYKTKSEWTKYLNKLKREFSNNQRDIK